MTRVLARDVGRVVAEDVEDSGRDGDTPRRAELVGADLEQRPVEAAGDPERPEAHLLELRRALAHVGGLAEAQLAAPDADGLRDRSRALAAYRSSRKRYTIERDPRQRGERPSKRARSRLWRRISTSSSASARRPSRRQTTTAGTRRTRRRTSRARASSTRGGSASRRQPARQAPFEHLAVYEYEGAQEQWRTDLNERIESGDIKLPEWFPQIQFGGWDCQPASGLLTAGAAGAADGRARTAGRDPGDPRPDRALRDLLRRQELGRLRRAVGRRRRVRRAGHGVRGQAGRARLPHDLPARRLHRQAHELAAAGRADSAGPRARAHRRRLDHDGLREPHRRALRRHVPARRRPLAVRAAHRGRRAVPGGRAADVGHGHGREQLDDAPGAQRRGGAGQ